MHPSVSVKGGLLRGVPVIHQRRPTADEEEESTALDGDFNPLTFEENLTLESEKLQVKTKIDFTVAMIPPVQRFQNPFIILISLKSLPPKLILSFLSNQWGSSCRSPLLSSICG